MYNYISNYKGRTDLVDLYGDNSLLLYALQLRYDIEDIISKLEVLKFVTDETKILIIALDRMRNDEMIQGIQKSGVVDYIITKEMIDDLEEQIHTNSKICSLKAKWYNKGIKFLLATVILWFVCMIFQLI